ncbi:hypothetical protein MTO96_017936 [Rhipicephalus appendiculatus]
MEDIQLLEQQSISLNERLYAARVEKEELEISEKSLRSCERNVLFHTGMANFTVLLAVFKLVESAVSHSINNSLSKFQEFILFMMKIKVYVSSGYWARQDARGDNVPGHVRSYQYILQVYVSSGYWASQDAWGDIVPGHIRFDVLASGIHNVLDARRAEESRVSSELCRRSPSPKGGRRPNKP